ncbi:MAG: DNA mismatch repair protein MutS [Bacteroidetes bacterium]|jgi:DNA mismatch repair protein MutS|nr:DNA mismatch repair protein MutS [Bacteroidota bacterium]
MAKKKKRGQTPLMRQYYKIKDRHPQAILLFRMGDFYEAFEDDAKTISSILGITLTKRSNGAAKDVPMAGIPHHALDNYLPKLIRAGKRVAICEQLEDAKYAKKVVKRGVVEVVTPGVSFSDELLNPKQSNYLAAIQWAGQGADAHVGVAFIDASTGEFFVTEARAMELPDLLQTISPAEVIIDKNEKQRLQDGRTPDFILTPQEDWVFGYDFGYETLLRHFETHSLKGFGVEGMETGLVAAGAALYYLSETQQGDLPHVRRIQRYERDDYMTLDASTKRNLELVTSMQGRGREGTLVEILDDTLTPMGGRLLRHWLLRPLRQVEAIERRLNAVEALVQAPERRGALRDELREIGDMERLAGKVATGRASPRDLVHLKLSLKQIPALKATLQEEQTPALADVSEALTLCRPVVTLIQDALVDDPPATISDGGLIRAGYDETLDDLRDLSANAKSWVKNMQQEESKRTGIDSLKVGFNKVFGYYLEVTNTHKEKVPEHYIRKQTLVNSERYITPELKEYEEKILTAQEKIERLEQELFNELRMAVAEETEALQRNASLIAMLDVFSTLAAIAKTNNYVRPDVTADRRLAIRAGRHPVVEQTLPPGESFIPNDVQLDVDTEQILVITGPNMAGKSVVLRQVGLLVLLAQVGSFVPADEAHVGVVDRIFTRVGASDNLAAGESTFLVEMNETANILNNASPASLILLDEVGRGTSTFDGLSIAWSLVEYLHEQPEVAARTLFATHYHELNELAGRLERVQNYSIQVKEHDGRIIFLRKMVAGGTDHSYGIDVARMAGLPPAVIDRARSVLHQLESQEWVVDEADASGDGLPPTARPQVPDLDEPSFQRSLFDAPPDPQAAALKKQVKQLDPDRMTPIEALMKLVELKALLGDEVA